MGNFFATLLLIQLDKSVAFIFMCTFKESELAAKLPKFIRKILNHSTPFRSCSAVHVFLKVYIDHYSEPSIADVVVRLLVATAENIERTQARNFVFSISRNKFCHHGRGNMFLCGIVVFCSLHHGIQFVSVFNV